MYGIKKFRIKIRKKLYCFIDRYSFKKIKVKFMFNNEENLVDVFDNTFVIGNSTLVLMKIKYGQADDSAIDKIPKTVLANLADFKDAQSDESIVDFSLISEEN